MSGKKILVHTAIFEISDQVKKILSLIFRTKMKEALFKGFLPKKEEYGALEAV